MGDWFDLNNDGNLDLFEEAAKLSHINNCVNYLENEAKQKETERRNLAAAEDAKRMLGQDSGSESQGKQISFGMMILIIIGLLILDYLLIKLNLAL